MLEPTSVVDACRQGRRSAACPLARGRQSPCRRSATSTRSSLALRRPSQSSIICTEEMEAIGFTMPFPACLGANRARARTWRGGHRCWPSRPCPCRLGERPQVGGNVAEHVAGHDHVVVLWIPRDPLRTRRCSRSHARCWIAFTHLVKGAAEQLAASRHVGFVHAGDATDAVPVHRCDGRRCRSPCGKCAQSRIWRWAAGRKRLHLRGRGRSSRVARRGHALPPCRRNGAEGCGRVLRVLAKHDHVDHVVVPDLTEGAVHLVLDPSYSRMGRTFAASRVQTACRG